MSCDTSTHRCCSKYWLQNEMNTTLNEPIKTLLQWVQTTTPFNIKSKLLWCECVAGTQWAWLQPLVRAELLFSARRIYSHSSVALKQTLQPLGIKWCNPIRATRFHCYRAFPDPEVWFRANAEVYSTTNLSRVSETVMTHETVSCSAGLNPYTSVLFMSH